MTPTLSLSLLLLLAAQPIFGSPAAEAGEEDALLQVDMGNRRATSLEIGAQEETPEHETAGNGSRAAANETPSFNFSSNGSDLLVRFRANGTDEANGSTDENGTADVAHTDTAWESASIGKVFKTKANKTVVVYMTHQAEGYHLSQTAKLAKAFGDEYQTLTPVALDKAAGAKGEHPQAKVMSNITDGGVEDSHWTGLNPLIYGQGGIILGKALMMMLEDPEIDYIWAIENDIHFKDASSLQKLVEEYAKNDADYIPVRFFDEGQYPEWPWWQETEGLLPRDQGGKPYGSWGYMMRVSSKLAKALVELDKEKGHLAFFEPLFPTLAMAKGMKVTALDPKWTAGFRWRPCWSEDEVKLQNAPFFHPVKVVNEKFGVC